MKRHHSSIECWGWIFQKKLLNALEERTEGWAAGLQLAALSIKGREDADVFVKAFTGSHVYISEYLVEEVLRRQPADIHDFLLKTSILNRLTAGLCEAVTGFDDGQTMLQAIIHANLFVIPLDDESKWYRYHHLFTDLLRVPPSKRNVKNRYRCPSTTCCILVRKSRNDH